MKSRYIKVQAIMLIAVLCISTLFLGNTVHAVSGVFAEEFVSLYTDVPANVFFGDAAPRFRVKLQNPYQRELTVTMDSQVDGRDDAAVWNGSKTVTLAPKETAVIGIAIGDKNLPYGMYDLCVEVSSSFSNTFSKSLEFAVAVENQEVNEWASVTFHLGDDPNYEDLEKNLALAAKAGFARNRDDVRWYRSETVIGNPRLPQWRKNVIEKVLDSGQCSPIYILGIEHFTYTGGLCPHEYNETVCAKHSDCEGNPYTFEEQVAAYARFCGYMAEELKGTKPVFELGNEPELDRAYPDSSRYFNFTGQDYAELVKAAYQAIKAVDAEATVISAGTCALANNNSKGFLEEFLSVEGITNYIDGLGFHPYPYTEHYTDEISAGNAAFYAQVDFAKAQLQAAMERDGTSGITLWATEFGSKVADDDWKQAAIDVRTMVMSRAEPSMQTMNIYNLVSKGADLSDGENRFGIIKKNYTAVKPAYSALSHMNLRLAGAEYQDGLFEHSYSGTRTFSAYGFKRETELTRQYTYVVWGHTGKNAMLTINKSGVDGSASTIADSENPTVTAANDAEVKVYDMVGNELPPNASYALGSEPIYVVATIRSADAIKMRQQGRQIYVSGRADAPGEKATLLAVKENSLAPAYIAFEQTVANSLSEYDFMFSLPEENAQYSVYVFDGNAKSMAGQRAEFSDLKIQYFVNGVWTDSLDDINFNDTIRAKLTLNNAGTNAENLRFYGVIYGETDVVLAVDAQSVMWDSANGMAEIELKAENVSEAKEMKIFLWNETMMPVTSPFEMQRRKEKISK